MGPTVIDDPKLVAEIGSLMLTYSIVLPSCGDKTCGEHITKRKLKRALKRSSQADRKLTKSKDERNIIPADTRVVTAHWKNIRNRVKKE